MSQAKLPKKPLHWWPALWPPLDQSCSSEFFMSVAFLVVAYVVFIFTRLAEWKVVSLVPAALYFAQIPLYVFTAGDLTRPEKFQSFVQQLVVALLVTGPLIYMWRIDWP